MNIKTCALCLTDFSFERKGTRGRYPKFCFVCRADKPKLKAHYYALFSATKPVKFCVSCGKNPVTQQSGSFCSLVCTSNAHQANRVRSYAKKRGINTANLVVPATVFERDAWICYICKEPTSSDLRGTINDRAPEIDHFMPIRAGGGHTYENVRTAHRKCNSVKGGLLFSDLLELAKKIVLAHEQKS